MTVGDHMDRTRGVKKCEIAKLRITQIKHVYLILQYN